MIHKMIKAIQKENWSAFLPKATYLIIYTLVSLMLAFLIWGINKGFDVTDEGYYILTLIPNQENIGAPNQIGVLFSNILGWTGIGLIGYRWLSVILNISSASWFAYAFWKYRQVCTDKANTIFGFTTTLAFLIMGNIFNFARSAITISYNSVANMSVITIAGFALLLLTINPKNVEKSRIFKLSSYFIGLILVLILLPARIPSAVAFILVFPFLLIFHGGEKNIRYFITLSKFVLFGAITGFVIQLQFRAGNIYGLDRGFNFVSNYRMLALKTALVHLNELVHYTPQLILSMYPYLLFTGISTAFYISSPLLKIKKYLWLFRIMVVGFLFYFLDQEVLGIYSLSPLDYRTSKLYVLFFVFLLVIILVIFIKDLPKIPPFPVSFVSGWRDFFIICIFLFSLPLIISTGSSRGSILDRSTSYILPWIALLILFLDQINSKNLFGNFIRLYTIIASLWLLVQFTDGFIMNPHRLIGSYFEQTETIDPSLNRARGLRVHPDTKETIEELNTILAEKTDYKFGDPILAQSVMPGFVYLLGGIAPGTPWMEDNFCHLLPYTQVDTSNIILLFNNEPSESMLGCMENAGIFYPEGFREVGEVWYNNQRSFERNTIKVFVPKITP